jgi:hypothetical protein
MDAGSHFDCLRLDVSNSQIYFDLGTGFEVLTTVPKTLALTFMRWPPPGFASIDASATLPNGTVFFWSAGQLQAINPDSENLWQSAIEFAVVDAACDFGSATDVFLFVGSQFWTFNLNTVLLSGGSALRSFAAIDFFLTKARLPPTGGPWTMPATGLQSLDVRPLDAALYNSTEGMVYFFQGAFYTRAVLNIGLGPTYTFGPFDAVASIASFVGTSYPFDWPSVTAAGRLPGTPGVPFFVRELQVAVAAGT